MCFFLASSKDRRDSYGGKVRASTSVAAPLPLSTHHSYLNQRRQSNGRGVHGWAGENIALHCIGIPVNCFFQVLRAAMMVILHHGTTPVISHACAYSHLTPIHTQLYSKAWSRCGRTLRRGVGEERVKEKEKRKRSVHFSQHACTRAHYRPEIPQSIREHTVYTCIYETPIWVLMRSI